MREQLARLAASVSSHPVRETNLHLTLVFLGHCVPAVRDCIRQAAGQVRQPAFDLTLDYLGGFPKPRIQWLGSQQAPQVLFDLQRTLHDAAVDCGLAIQDRRFVPHVTLSRKIKQPCFQVIEAPLEWRVEEFVLAESCPAEGGVQYRILARWGLG